MLVSLGSSYLLLTFSGILAFMAQLKLVYHQEWPDGWLFCSIFGHTKICPIVDKGVSKFFQILYTQKAFKNHVKEVIFLTNLESPKEAIDVEIWLHRKHWTICVCKWQPLLGWPRSPATTVSRTKSAVVSRCYKTCFVGNLEYLDFPLSWKR